MTGPSARRVLIVWWGTSKRGSPTIGDYMAVSNLVLALQSQGVEVDVATHRSIAAHDYCDFHAAKVVNWVRANPRNYKSVAFVCGPLSNERYFRLLFYRFKRARRVAVGVSVIDQTLPGTRLFDKIVARDGLPESYFDLAFAGSLQQPAGKSRSHIAVCLRGHQGEYGDAQCKAERLDGMILNVAQSLGRPVEVVSTIPARNNPVERIHRLFSDAELVITTRLHGALLALHHRTPFVAVDQIEGGRKVSAVIGRLRWPYLYGSNVDKLTLESACRAILNDPKIVELISQASQNADRLSKEALRKAVEAILLDA